MQAAIQIFLYFASAVFLGVMCLVGFRLFADNGVWRLTVGTSGQEIAAQRLNIPLNLRYRELLELGMIQLLPDENVVAGCGSKGEIEEVLLFTNRRAFIMSRHQGATFFAKHTFSIDRLRPIPSSAAMVGNKIVLSDGTQTAAIDSPGSEGYLADTKVVVRELNLRILQAGKA